MVGAKSGTNPAIMTWIIVKQPNVTRFFYPDDFNIGGMFVYPGLSQSKLFIPIAPGDIQVTVYYTDSNCVAEAP
ncbi:hypothetical protein [Pseudovibrio sp. WM33]|uniref:hypothetical protein n=1 Tax=Pseudovibrio sp. WM33 TaxID=1735585 RepID=UPI0007AE8111|nr:hypothetical protein [Pseudovibrio sp. WM33]